MFCNAVVCNSCYVPMEGQCAVNRERCWYLCATVGTAVYWQLVLKGWEFFSLILNKSTVFNAPNYNPDCM